MQVWLSWLRHTYFWGKVSKSQTVIGSNLPWGSFELLKLVLFNPPGTKVAAPPGEHKCQKRKFLNDICSDPGLNPGLLDYKASALPLSHIKFLNFGKKWFTFMAMSAKNCSQSALFLLVWDRSVQIVHLQLAPFFGACTNARIGCNVANFYALMNAPALQCWILSQSSNAILFLDPYYKL